MANKTSNKEIRGLWDMVEFPFLVKDGVKALETDNAFLTEDFVRHLRHWTARKILDARPAPAEAPNALGFVFDKAAVRDKALNSAARSFSRKCDLGYESERLRPLLTQEIVKTIAVSHPEFVDDLFEMSDRQLSFEVARNGIYVHNDLLADVIVQKEIDQVSIEAANYILFIHRQGQKLAKAKGTSFAGFYPEEPLQVL